MMPAGGGPLRPPAPPGGPPGAPQPALPSLMLPQARLPQPTVFDGTTPPFQEWMQETRNFLSINNYEFVRQMDYSLQSDAEVTLRDVAESTTRGRERRQALDVNEDAQDTLTENTTYDQPTEKLDVQTRQLSVRLMYYG